MRAQELVQLMRINSAVMSEQFVRKIRASGKCRELLNKVPESEQRRFAGEIYQARLTGWEVKPTMLEELAAKLGISEIDFGGKLKIVAKAPVVASKHRIGDSTSLLMALFGMEHV